ncbi:hypothetical protein [Bacteriovorax sp. BAL6_X]|uniref:hypothetical protein n=1 Tax=Bacteriovorax sp. BAL6_X TaxID=1201290 RepID=UPI000590ECB3|nr:hypothetical protein [Bacteriovorax sp. BAL6_X]
MISYLILFCLFMIFGFLNTFIDFVMNSHYGEGWGVLITFLVTPLVYVFEDIVIYLFFKKLIGHKDYFDSIRKTKTVIAYIKLSFVYLFVNVSYVFLALALFGQDSFNRKGNILFELVFNENFVLSRSEVLFAFLSVLLAVATLVYRYLLANHLRSINNESRLQLYYSKVLYVLLYFAVLYPVGALVDYFDINIANITDGTTSVLGHIFTFCMTFFSFYLFEKLFDKDRA